MITFAATTLALAVASIAMACTGTHSGSVWLCSTSSCGYSSRVSQPDNDLQYYGNASGLDAEGSGACSDPGLPCNYDIRYTAGDHRSESDSACNTGSIFTGGGAITTSGTGTFSGVLLTMPNVTGTYTICAIPSSGSDAENGSSHMTGLINFLE